MKKLTYFFNLCLLTAFFCLTGINSVWGAVTYSITGTGSNLTLTISGTGDMDDYSSGTAPWYSERAKIKHIVISDGVTSVGNYAFEGISSSSADITVPVSCTSFGNNAFANCSTMVKIFYAGSPNEWAGITFSNQTAHPFGAVSSAGQYYFYGNTSSYTNPLVFFPPLEEIKPYTFQRCSIPDGLSIPGTVATIGDYAFYGISASGSNCEIAFNRKESPTMGENSFRGLGTNKTAYVPTGATGYRTSGSYWYFSLSKKDVSGTSIPTYGANVKWKLSEDGVLTLDASDPDAVKSITLAAAANYPWRYFRRLVHKIVLKGEISALNNTLRYHYGISEVILHQQTVPTVNANYIAGNNYASLFDKSGSKLTLRIPPELEGDAGLSSAPWNDATHWNVVVTDYCADPSDLTEGTINATSATFTWTDDRGSSWKYLCKTLGSAEPTSSEWASAPSTSSKSATATGLTPATDYTFYLMADCGSAGTSDVLSADFTTECSVIASASVPWSYGFETGVTNNEIPRCWKEVKKSGSTAGSVTANSYNKRTGSYCLSIAGGNSSGYTKREIIAIFPAFEDDIKDLALSFWYKTSVTDGDRTYGQPQLGYITDPEDDDTFEAVGVALAQTADYTQVEDINMSGAPSGARFAILYTGGTDNGNVYIDDITVTAKPACNKPTGVSAGSVTDEGATISWNANSMSAWEVQVSEGDAASWGSSMNVATNSKVLTGLNANTLYYVRVRANCGAGEANKSEWSDNVSFTTLCGTINVSASSSWNIDFEGLGDHVIPECWDNSASTTSSTWGEGYIWGTFERNSNKSLAIDNSVCDGGTALINTPDIAIPNDGREYELTFDYSNMASENNLSVKISANGGAFVEKGTYYPSGNVSSYPGAFSNAIISLADYSGQTIKIQFFANPTSGTASEGGAMFVDNVSVHKVPTCFAPTDLAFGNLTANSARATWTAGGSETAWRLQYRADGGSWSAEQSVSSTAAYDIESLSANTLYYVRVKAYCDVTDQSDWSEEGSFTTLCAAESMPFNEAFSSYTALPSCWQATPADGTYRWRAYENSGAYSVQLRTGSSGEAELRMPAISLSEDAILRFEWKNADGANANIYISTDGGTTKTLIPNDLSAVYADWTTKIFDLSAYTDETAVIYFVSNFTTANKYAYLDDVEIVARPCEMILNVQAAPITGGANISWSGNVKKLQYKTGSDAWSSVTIASGDYAGPKQITGLTPARTYQVRLLPACSAEEEANWTTPIIFATSAIESVPYYNNFENEAEGELPFNWSRISVTGYPQISYDSYAYHENFGEKGHSIKFYGVNDQIIVLPEFNMALENLLVSFHYRNRDCRMELGYVEEDGSTFVALETLPNQTGYGEFPYEKVLASISASASKLAIRYSDATGSSSMAFVDNVSVFVPTCAQPVAVTLGTVTHNSAYLSWEASELDTETSYQYICRPWTNADPNWNSAVTLSASVHELNLTGLSANTSYEFYIRSYCGVSDQSTPISMEFKTALRHEVFEDSQSATNNESRLAALEGQTINVTFNRALQRNGDYSTISLPFNLSAADLAKADCPLRGFVIREYNESVINTEEVNIFLEQVFSIEAGKAYFVRYAGEPTDEPLQPLNFNNVTITASQPTYEVDGNLTLHGLFNPLAVTANDETTLFLGGGNLLYYPSVDGFIKGFRAYFKVDGGGPIAHAIRRGTPIRISEGKNTPTEIEQLQNNDTVVKVIEQGHVIIIRNGQKYNVQGQLIH